MNSVLRYVFYIVGVTLASLLLFTMTMGDTGRSIVWGAIEPVFEAVWRNESFNDGAALAQHIDRNFESLEEIGSDEWLH